MFDIMTSLSVSKIMIGSQEHPNYRSDTQLTSRSYSVTFLGWIVSVLERPGETPRLWARPLDGETDSWKVFCSGSGVTGFVWRSWSWPQSADWSVSSGWARRSGS